MVVLFLIVVASETTGSNPCGPVDYIDYIFSIIALSGVYGYCYGKKILSEIFWKSYLPFIVIWDLFIAYSAIQSNQEIVSCPIYLYLYIILHIVFLLPEYIGLYLYGYSQNKNST